MTALLSFLACTTPPAAAPEQAATDEASTDEASSTAAEAPDADGEAAPAPTSAKASAITVGDGVTVTPVYHGTVLIEHGDVTVWIDPWTKAPMPTPSPADLILVTDIHRDHLDAAAIAPLVGEGTRVVAPAAVRDALAADKSDVVVHEVLANGATTKVGEISITAVPMYNLERGPEPGKLYHDKGRGNGYLLSIGGATVYVAGDTACTSEMKALTGIDLALVPMNLPYTMPPEEAAECVAAFRPKVVTPYHYGSSDLSVFTSALSGIDGVTVTLVDAYPGGLPF